MMTQPISEAAAIQISEKWPEKAPVSSDSKEDEEEQE